MFQVEKYQQACRELIPEGIVLLKNENGVLPFKSTDKIALFSRGQFEYVKSGSGSGGRVNCPYITQFYDEFSSRAQLDEEVSAFYRDFIAENPAEGDGWTYPASQKQPLLPEELVKRAAEKNDKAVFILSRICSEADPYPGETAYRAEIGTGGSREFVKEEGVFDGSYKYTINKNSWTAAVEFINTNSPAYSSSTKFVTAEIYFKNVESFFVQDQLGWDSKKGPNNYYDGFNMGVEKTDGIVLFYDMDGNAVTVLENETWYKIAIPLKAVYEKTWGALTLQVTYNTEANSSAYVYLKNQAYGGTNIYAK